MLVDSYKRKIQPFLRFYKVVYKFRALFLTLLILLAGTTATLLSIKGMVIDTIKLEDTSYGETLNYSSKGFMSDYIHYEFKEKDGDAWTRDEPYLAGEYQIRGVSKNIFGRYYYGSPHDFKILPLVYDVSTEDNARSTYGEIPNLNYGLIGSDEIIEAEFSYQSISGTTAQVSLVKDSLVIVNNKGENVTGCYDLNFNSTYSVSLSSRDITFSYSENYVYDGKEHRVEEVEIQRGSLFEGDRFEIVDSPKHVDTGNYFDKPTLKFVDKSGRDVTNLYDYSFSSSKLVISGIPLTIKTGDFSKTYDNKVSSIDVDYTITEGKLINGHRISLEAPRYINVGNYQNKPAYTIYDSTGKNVTKNYSVSIDCGKYVINPRKIYIDITTTPKEYDGSVISTYRDVSGLLEGHYISYIWKNYIDCIHSGFVTPDFDYEVYDELNDRDVSSNYEFIVSSNGSNVSKRNITLKTVSLNFKYDGNIKYAPGINVVEGSLAATDSIKVISCTRESEIGSYENVVDFKILHSDDFETTTDYNITLINGTLKISEDGEDLDNAFIDSDYGFHQKSPDEGNVPNDQMIFTYEPSQEHGQTLLKGTSYGDYHDGTLSLPSKTYSSLNGISPSTFISDLLRNEPEITGNISYNSLAFRSYDLVYPYPTNIGQQKSDRYSIVSDLTTSEVSFTGHVYNYLENPEILDNATFSSDEYVIEEMIYRAYVYKNYVNVDSNQIPALEEIINDNSLKGTDLHDTLTRIVDYYNNNFRYEADNIPSVDKEDPVLDFLVNTHAGKCDFFAEGATLLLRTMGYAARMIGGYAINGTGDVEEIYGDNAHAQTEVYVDGKGWVAIEVTVPGDGNPYNPGGSDSGGGGGSTPSDPELKEDILIESLSGTYIYDNEYHSREEYLLYGSLKPNHQLYVDFNSKIKYFGKKQNSFTYRILDANGKNVIDEYKIETSFGTLKVNEREITITTESITLSMSQLANYVPEYTLENQAPGIHTLNEDNSMIRSITSPGTYKNMLFITSIIDTDGVNVTSCYKINYVYGTLTVTN